MIRTIAGAALAWAAAGVAWAGLSAEAAGEAAEGAWEAYAERFAAETADEMAAGRIEVDDSSLSFLALSFEGGQGEPCDAPCAAADGRRRPLFISMHGGGGTAAEVNDQQWANQLKLGYSYAPSEGIYVAPRAPTNEWNCWHGAQVDALLTRLILAFVAAGTVDPDRVYLMGYSAGGDGVYALSPRMADRFAAAAMMAGHPNGVSLENVRNLPFAIHMGQNDTAYDRAGVAAEYGRKLEAMQADDPLGYEHQVMIHPGKGHWMDLEDRVAVPWMEGFVRDPWPSRVVWRLGGLRPEAFYWIGLPEGGEEGDLFVGVLDGQTVTLEGPSGRAVEVRFADGMMDLDQPVTILSTGGETLYEGVVERDEATIERAVEERGDPAAIYEAAVTVTLP